MWGTRFYVIRGTGTESISNQSNICDNPMLCASLSDLSARSPVAFGDCIPAATQWLCHAGHASQEKGHFKICHQEPDGLRHLGHYDISISLNSEARKI